jgi:DNA-directed RNA polymerase specialized sigma24 family protein
MAGVQGTSGRTGGHPILDETADVVHALLRYEDVFDPKSGSILVANGNRAGFDGEPFRGNLLMKVEERAELRRRLARLDERERELLCLWYIASWPAVKIARRLGISRVHCYRLRKRALDAMTVDRPGGPSQ